MSHLARVPKSHQTPSNSFSISPIFKIHIDSLFNLFCYSPWSILILSLILFIKWSSMDCLIPNLLLFGFLSFLFTILDFIDDICSLHVLVVVWLIFPHNCNVCWLCGFLALSIEDMLNRLDSLDLKQETEDLITED